MTHYVLSRPECLDSVEALLAYCHEFKPLRRALDRHYGSVEHAHAVLQPWCADPDSRKPKPRKPRKPVARPEGTPRPEETPR